ncbi:MAG: hypothetical protein EOP04_22510 [Proteobacteria bacterium]|nr:MAG: hypothetical protein EOP04_22510 [Pseudomonadota bacterium]
MDSIYSQPVLSFYFKPGHEFPFGDGTTPYLTKIQEPGLQRKSASLCVGDNIDNPDNAVSIRCSTNYHLRLYNSIDYSVPCNELRASKS